MTFETQNVPEGGPRLNGLDLDVFISNDWFAIRFHLWALVLTIASGVGLMVAAHQAWFPLDDTLARPAATLAGACMTGLGGFPLMAVLDRIESIRVIRALKEARDKLLLNNETDEDVAQFLEDIVRRLYEKRILG